jgi:cytochrome P450
MPDRKTKDKADWFSLNSERSYNFGAGVHLCPGRLFAAMELKVLLATILMRYDFRVEDTETAYQSGVRGLMFIPDPKKKMWMKRRTEGPLAPR